MTLYEKINADLKDAMKAKSEEELTVLRMLTTAVRNKQIMDYGESGQELNDEQVTDIIKSEVKKRNESVKLFIEGGRIDLADKEKSEISILMKYMPEQMSEEDVIKKVEEIVSGMGEVQTSDFGKIMGQVMAQLKGKADGNVVSQAVKKVLNK